MLCSCHSSRNISPGLSSFASPQGHGGGQGGPLSGKAQAAARTPPMAPFNAIRGGWLGIGTTLRHVRQELEQPPEHITPSLTRSSHLAFPLSGCFTLHMHHMSHSVCLSADRLTSFFKLNSSCRSTTQTFTHHLRAPCISSCVPHSSFYSILVSSPLKSCCFHPSPHALLLPLPLFTLVA